VFLVRSVYFNLRNILPKSGTFLQGYPVYEAYIYCYERINSFGYFNIISLESLSLLNFEMIT